MSLVDFHLHFFSRPFFNALATQSPLPGTIEEKLARVAAETGIELPPDSVEAHLARWLAEFDRHEVEHACAFASLPQEIPALAEARRLAPERLTPFALVDATAEGVDAKVRTLVREQGFGGVLLFPALHHYSMRSPAVRPLLAALDELGALAYVHCGLLVVGLRDRLGLPRTQDPTWANPLDLVAAANAFPRARFVIPHFGAGFFRETLMAGSQCANVFVDSSSSNSWIATQTRPMGLRDVLRRTLDVFGTERLLFGTDSNVFPRGWRRDLCDGQRHALELLGLDAEERERILGGNARRLLGLDD